jgi:RecA/RadA recombinase
MPLLKRKKSDADQIKESAQEEANKNVSFESNKGNFDLIISTGSTLLDLAITGKRQKGGGVPGGILIEFFGPSGGGKTALLAELCGSAQKRGGEVNFTDPEARLDQEYTQIYGVSVKEDFFNYSRPDTVSQVFDMISNWKPKNEKVINLFGGDSVAALSTNMEMDEGDKMGMRRAKEFSEGLRKTCRLIRNNNWIVAFTNQIRQDTSGHNVTPGGMGLPFYASLRIQVSPAFPIGKIKKKVKLASRVEVEKIIGINSLCTIVKSSIDEPFRTAPINIIFGYGIDDIRANLQYRKDMTKETSYDVITKTYGPMQDAIKHIEENGLEKELREKTIVLWEEIQEQFSVNRKPKGRN